MFAAASVLPCLSFAIAGAAASASNPSSSMRWNWLTLAVYVFFIAVPSWFPVVAAPDSWRWGAVAMMAITGAVAGAAVGSSDDAQAGLSVFIVAPVAAALTGVLLLARAVIALRADRDKT